ncbi:MAG: hypothetical protein H6737_20585 [Alphaproteobacteria bacterium]|nr:hypothetical protein [Alphaproteobacteria bacterium]
MLDDLLPKGLTDAARRLGVEPLEVVRLMVVTDTVSDGFAATDDHVAKLAAFGAIETGWWEGAELPKDKNESRQRVRAAIGLVLGRCAGGVRVRMDNLWRGLPLDAQELVEEAMNVLSDEGLVRIENAASGVLITVPADSEAQLRELASGKADSDGLNELYQD